MTASSVEIVPVTTEEQRRKFASFAWRVYRHNPSWVPPIFGDRLKLLDPHRHPFWEHAEQQLFMAQRDQEIVGTISAHINDRHNEVYQDKVGFFGFFEVLDDRAVAEAERLLAEHEVPPLAEDQERELDEIMREAERELGASG